MDARKERRAHPRYFVPRDIHIPGSLRVGGESYLGKLMNLSPRGILMSVERWTPAASQAAWEIQYQGKVLQGTGHIQQRGDTLIAVALDEPAGLQLLIEQINTTTRPLGAIERREGTATVRGFLDFETARHLLRQIRAGDGEIDLAQCDDLDSSGLGVLLIAQQEGVKLSGCHGKVQQIAAIVGMCRHCPPGNCCAYGQAALTPPSQRAACLRRSPSA